MQLENYIGLRLYNEQTNVDYKYFKLRTSALVSLIINYQVFKQRSNINVFISGNKNITPPQKKMNIGLLNNVIFFFT